MYDLIRLFCLRLGLFLICFLAVFGNTTPVFANEKETKQKQNDIYNERYRHFLEMETLFHIPWQFLAAIDQYERTIQHSRKDRPKFDKKALFAIYIPEFQWAGIMNPNYQDTNPATIKLFGGIGLDGNGDGAADPLNDQDRLLTLCKYLESFGTTRGDIRIALWHLYQEDDAVERISQFAAIYEHFGRLDLFEHVFPVPKGWNYTYRGTWGDRRGWGGIRIHEGTDIFASYGTPVRSTAYGYVDIMGWNPYGGWRIGIRDLNNYYYYFAHLSSFKKGLKTGDIVKPGDVIGYVGSSGYGPPGTQGKFPPHLHFGMYKDTGKTEWSFDPYPHLKRWEREMYRKNKASKAALTYLSLKT